MFPGFNFGFGHPEPRQQRPPRQEVDPFSAMFGGLANLIGLEGPEAQQQRTQQNQQRPQQQRQPQPPQRPQQQQPQPQPPRANPPQPKKQQKSQPPKPQPQQYPVGSAPYWKQLGNEAFQKSDFKTALDCYNKAISVDDTQSVLFSNRAKCHKILMDLDKALADAQTSIELDDQNFKAHLIAGQVLAEMGKKDPDSKRIQTAISRLTKAKTLSSVQNKPQFAQQLQIYLRRAKKLLWYKQFEQLRNTRIKAINDYKKCLEGDSKLQKEEIEQKLRSFIEATNQNVELHIPDSYQCKITFDLMKEPVVTQAGQTYEKSAIQEHIQRNGRTDPFTREPIGEKLYPNIGLKAAIEGFIDSNPWAYEFQENEDYNKIQF